MGIVYSGKKNTFVDLTFLMNMLECSAKDNIEILLQRFDIVQAHRSEVKHYPIHVKGPNTNEFVVDQLKSMNSTIWWTVRNAVVLEMMNKYTTVSQLLNALTIGGKLGQIKVVPPLTFDHVNTQLSVLKPFARSYAIDDNELEIQAEINFTVELYFRNNGNEIDRSE